ncbi:hypothetical protein GBA52_006581 [Prunus armeniaca]|nr:hypothetical protein GBA52_006581 [Prunus armeniaca]
MKCSSNVTTTTSVAVAATPRRLSLWPWVQTRGKSRYVTTTTAVAVAATLRRLSREALGRKVNWNWNGLIFGLGFRRAVKVVVEGL